MSLSLTNGTIGECPAIGEWPVGVLTIAAIGAAAGVRRGSEPRRRAFARDASCSGKASENIGHPGMFAGRQALARAPRRRQHGRGEPARVRGFYLRDGGLGQNASRAFSVSYASLHVFIRRRVFV